MFPSMSLRSFLLFLLLRCVDSFFQESTLLASCEEQPGNLLLQKHAAAHTASALKPWDRRTYLVATSHKAGTEMLRNVMRRAFTILGAKHSCKQNWDLYDLPITPEGGQNWCMNDSAPIRYENGNKPLTIDRLRSEGRPMRGVMMLRDPMSMIVSAYTYHHRGNEIGHMGVPPAITSLGPKEGVPLCSHMFEHTVKDMVGAYEDRGDEMFVSRFEDWTRSAEDFNLHVAKMIDFLFDDEITKEERAAILTDAQKEDANGPYGLSQGLSVYEDGYLARDYNIHRNNHSNPKDSEEEDRIGLDYLSPDMKEAYESYRKRLDYA